LAASLCLQNFCDLLIIRGALQILGAVSQFIIPIDQRTYSWTLKECQQLWADILRAGSGNSFLASVLLLLQ
jgi:uncharacterized protein with ParB-like and HNH nuclease domain